MKCPNCGSENSEGAKFCEQCGTKLPPPQRKCPSCGTVINGTPKFCPECGCKLDGSGSPSKAAGGGLSLGDKNVVAGDVIGNKDEYHVSGNATIVKNEDDTKKLAECSVCGKHTLFSEGFTCPECHRFVCAEHFNAEKNCCTACEKAKENNTESQYKALLAEVYKDGKVSTEERHLLEQKRSELGLPQDTATALEAAFEKKVLSDIPQLTKIEEVMVQKAADLLLKEYDCSAAYKKLSDLYQKHPDNEQIISLFLRAAKKEDPDKALDVIQKLNVDVKEAYLTASDIYIAKSQMEEAERQLANAKQLWPDDVEVLCKYATFFTLFAPFGVNEFLDEAKKAVAALPSPADDNEAEEVDCARAFLDRVITSDSAPFYETFKKYSQTGKNCYDFQYLIHEVYDDRKCPVCGKFAASKDWNETAGCCKSCTAAREAAAAEQRKEENRKNPAVSPDGSAGYSSLNEAIHDVPEGSVIKVQPGTYHEHLILTKTITLEGVCDSNGNRPVIYEDVDTAKYVIDIQVPVVLKNLCVMSSLEPVPAAYKYPNLPEGTDMNSWSPAGIYICADASLTNCEVMNTHGVGIRVVNGSAPVLTGCIIHDTHTSGILVAQQSAPVCTAVKIYSCGSCGFNIREKSCGTYESCDIYQNANSGIEVRDEGTNPAVKGCKIHDEITTGILIKTKGSGTYENCDIYQNAYSGIEVRDEGTIPVVRGCKIHDGKSVGMYVHGKGSGTYDNCDIYQNAKAGIIVEDEGTNPAVKGCKIHDGKQSGICVHGKGSGTYENCDIYQNDKAGIQVTEEGTNPAARRCKIHDGKSVGMYVGGKGSGTYENCDIYQNEMDGIEVTEEGTSPAVKGCKIHDGKDRGIYVHGKGCGTYENCDIYQNTYSGIEVTGEGTSPAVKGCKIHDGRRSAIWVHYKGCGTYENCDIYQNALSGIGAGVALEDDGTNAAVTNCRIEKNAAGIQVTGKVTGTCTGCTFADNTTNKDIPLFCKVKFEK